MYTGCRIFSCTSVGSTFLPICHLSSRFCQIPISPGRIWQTVEHSQIQVQVKPKLSPRRRWDTLEFLAAFLQYLLVACQTVLSLTHSYISMVLYICVIPVRTSRPQNLPRTSSWSTGTRPPCTRSCSPRTRCHSCSETRLPEFRFLGCSTDMHENMWARLRDSRPGARVIHAT